MSAKYCDNALKTVKKWKKLKQPIFIQNTVETRLSVVGTRGKGTIG